MTEEELLNQLERALNRLREALTWEKEEDDRSRDSAILRFALCAELAWKAVKFHMEDVLKVRCASPKACFREAYNQGLIEYENRWLDMVDDHNNVAHLYQEAMAEALYGKLQEYTDMIDRLLQRLREER